jgi:hypothetical protein
VVHSRLGSETDFDNKKAGKETIYMKTLAAVLLETNKPLQIMELTIPELRRGQVLVKVVCSGLCHTQLRCWSKLYAAACAIHSLMKYAEGKVRTNGFPIPSGMREAEKSWIQARESQKSKRATW